ncbi:hypothetical protein Q8A67_006843 [Cirrhinus molitorella]|uniref:Leucine-rich repeat flightless-interacting protein 1 n=1 Tax=Cirrhinus molitorella TaxID=172907 RepID=A0AA88Q2G5_9TELE|nr:hypothetical protein Q8A67_006843 [Cirrhinus molitorella]
MGSQGPGRKRTPSKNGLTAEEDALNVIAKEAEARLAAKRAARAEAREIRMKELERQQKEASDDEERMSVGSRSNIRADDRLERDYLEKGSSRASTISGATLTSLGGTSSRRGSGDTSISADTEASIREIKDSLLEVEEKYRKAMVSNAQLDNEKTNMMYEVDTLKDSLMELEEMLFETRRELEEKCKDLEREKHAHSILQFQFSELKETLKQSEELLTKHGIVLGPDLATNGETGEEVGKADENSQTASAEIREGSSVLGTHQLKVCKDQQQKDLDDGVPGNQPFSHAQFSSTNTPLQANKNEELEDQTNQGVEQLENRPEEPPSSVGDDELTATRPKEEMKSEELVLEESRENTVELGCNVHKDGHLEMDQQESECVKPSQVIKEETPLELVSDSVHDEIDKPGEMELDDKLKVEPVESSETEKPAKTQCASASNKKKKKKKKNKQKQKPSEKQENETKVDDKKETVCSEDNPKQKMESDLEEHHQEPLGNDVSETTVKTDVPQDAKRTSELDSIETRSTNINADDVQDKILLVTDEADLAEPSKTISNFDCPESNNGILLDDLSNNIISNPTNIIEHTEDLTNPDSEAVGGIFSCGVVSSETETLPHEPSRDAVEGSVESSSCSENIEKSSSVDLKEVKSPLDCEIEQEEKLQNINVDGTTNLEDQDDSTHPSSPVMENVENEAERVIQEQPIDQPTENQPQDSTRAALDQEEVETQDELDKENLQVRTEKAVDTQDSIGAELDQEEVETQDALDKENLQVPTEKAVDTQDSIGAELDQEEVEIQDELDKENLQVPTEKAVDTQDSIGAELDQEEVEIQDELNKENTEVPAEKVADTQNSIGAKLDQEEVETQDELDKENIKVPTEKVADTQDSSGAELDQEEVETQDDLDKENIEVLAEQVADTQNSIEAKLDQEEVETQDELDKENKVPTEKAFDGSHVDNPSLTETQVQDVLEDDLSPNEAIQESAGESEASDQEPKVEKDEDESSIQNQVMPAVQLPEDEEDLLVKSDVAAQELKEEDEEEEDEGESFDFDETDLEASSDAPLKNLLDQPNEEDKNVQEASQEYQSNVTDEAQTQEVEHLELADQESKSNEKRDDGQDTENPQTAMDAEGCLTKDSQINSEVRPNDQQHDASGNKDAFEEHQQPSEDVTLNEGVNLITEMERRDVAQEINSSIHHEKKTLNISGGQEVEKQIAESSKEDERRESKKSGKGKGKGKGKEDCKMS